MEFPHDELIGQGIEHKVEVQAKGAGSALATLSYPEINIDILHTLDCILFRVSKVK